MPALTLDDGRTLRYDDYGSGPVIMLIHGSPGSSRAWQSVGQRLSDRFRIVAPNLPGYGGSDPRPTDAAPDTGWVASLVEALMGAVGSPLVLAGHSYGGNVALGVALGRRVAIKGLALFEPVALRVLQAAGDDEAYAAAKAVTDDYVASYEGGDSRAVRKMIAMWFGAGAFERMPEPMQSYLMRETAQNVLDVKATHRERYALPDLQHLAIPTLLVHGSRSPRLAFQVVDAIARQLQRGSVVKLEGGTHAMTTTHDEAIAALLAEHAARCAPAPAPDPPAPAGA
jgi:pimeloyl-ACP methyl ester carboxylesterase